MLILFKPRIRTPTPEPVAVEEAEETKADNNDDDDASGSGNDEPEKKMAKIYKLPPCNPLQVDENGTEKRARIPEPLPLQKSDDFDISNVRKPWICNRNRK